MFGYEIVFVHGAWAGPWVWRTWSPFFASNGWAVRAITLPGHGPGDFQSGFGLEDGANYLEQAITQPEKTILFGHSMGGWVCLKFMETHKVAASVLVAPMPINGLPRKTRDAMLRLAPIDTVKTIFFGVPSELRDDNVVRATCFLPDTPQAVVSAFRQRSCQLSARAARQMALFPLFGPRINRRRMRHTQEGIPHLLLASETDFYFKPKDLMKTAGLLGTSVELCEGYPHCMMEVDDSRKLAARVEEWLKQHLRPNI